MTLFPEIFDEDSLLHGYDMDMDMDMDMDIDIDIDMENIRKTFRNCCIRAISSQTRIGMWIFI
jgi:hypothetical protein